jgi:hypothetical protein
MLEKDIEHNGGVAKWADVVMLYEKDGQSVDSKITKLTENHIKPEGKLKIKVCLATQVFSTSVYAAMTLVQQFGYVDSQGTYG